MNIAFEISLFVAGILTGVLLKTFLSSKGRVTTRTHTQSHETPQRQTEIRMPLLPIPNRAYVAMGKENEKGDMWQDRFFEEMVELGKQQMPEENSALWRFMEIMQGSCDISPGCMMYGLYCYSSINLPKVTPETIKSLKKVLDQAETLEKIAQKCASISKEEGDPYTSLILGGTAEHPHPGHFIYLLLHRQAEADRLAEWWTV